MGMYDNYLGKRKGVLSVGLYVNDVKPAAEFIVGNMTELSVAYGSDAVEVENSATGIGKALAKIQSSETLEVKFTTQNISKKNIAMMFRSAVAEIAQSAGYATETLAAELGMVFSLEKKKVGSFYFAFSSVTGDFEAGEDISSTSGAVGKVVAVGDSAIYAVISSGTVASGETITGGASAAEGTTSAAGVFTLGYILATNTAGTTVYSVSRELADTTSDIGCAEETSQAKFGQITFNSESTLIVDGSDVVFFYNYDAGTISRINVGSETEITVRMTLMSKNQIGSKESVRFHLPKVTITPNGDISFLNLGDELQTLAFTGTVLLGAGAPELDVID